MILILFTNGTLLTEEVVDILKEYPPYLIEVSIYGATEKTYEKVTSVKGSFRRCMSGIDLLLSKDLPLKLKSMIMSLNREEVDSMKRLAKILGVRFRYDYEISAGIDGSKEPCDFRINPEDVVNMEASDEKHLKAWKKLIENFGPPESQEDLYVCCAGLSSFHIDPYGELSPCLGARSPSCSLKRLSFKDGWDNFMPTTLKRKVANNYKCGNCRLISLCGHCPGTSIFEHGNAEIPVEYFCKIAHLRAEAIGVINEI